MAMAKINPTLKLKNGLYGCKKAGICAKAHKIATDAKHKLLLSIIHMLKGMWCNLDSTPASGAVGCGFKSRHARFYGT